MKWPKDPYLVATFHDYGPHEFTHQGASWEETPPPLGRKWGNSEDKAELKETYDIAKAFQAKTGLPVFVGEFGVIDFVPTSEFNHFDTETNRWLPGMQDALGLGSQ